MGFSTNAWMVFRSQKSPEAYSWTIRQWEEAVGVSIGTIHATDTWKALQAAADGERMTVQPGGNRTSVVETERFCFFQKSPERQIPTESPLFLRAHFP